MLLWDRLASWLYQCSEQPESVLPQRFPEQDLLALSCDWLVPLSESVVLDQPEVNHD